MKFIDLFVLFLLLGISGKLSAQYYETGQDPFRTKWNVQKTPHYKLIYPIDFQKSALHILTILDTIRSSAQFGYTQGAEHMPVILHPQNLHSNGFVAWAPKRMALITSPPLSTFAEPWLRQLSIHEYRHAVQISNLNYGTIKWLSYLIGQQAGGAASGLIPKWFLEGDATLAETQLSTYGRGLQPNFTIAYRAYVGSGEQFRNTDKWFCGSYRDYIPDYYALGYQVTNWSYTRYGKDIWNKVTHYSAHYPFLILTTKFALHHYYRTSVGKLFRETFHDLSHFWNNLPPTNPTPRVISTPHTSYTTYNFPLEETDSTLIALKTDFDRPQRFVRVHKTSGAEECIAYTGSVSSRPVLHNGELLWTEYRPSTFWEQKNHSVVCRRPLREVRQNRLPKKSETGHYAPPHFSKANHSEKSTKTQILRSPENRLLITALPEGWVFLTYNYRDGYHFVFTSEDFTERARIATPENTTLHGLAFDETENQLIFIGLNDSGMYLGTYHLSTGIFGQLTTPAAVSLDNLRAAQGKLYFNSIQSGKDEAHFLDLKSGKQYRITTSNYGSFAPAPAGDGTEIFCTTYTREGYLLAQQTLSDSLPHVNYSRLPVNLVNPPRLNWITTDTSGITPSPAATKSQQVYNERTPTKQYRKGLHVINIHSWAPVAFDPILLNDEKYVPIRLGITLLSQNLLANTIGYASYGWINHSHWLKSKVSYLGFAPKIEVDFEWGGGKQLLYSNTYPLILNTPLPAPKSYFSIHARSYLPINLSGGYHHRYLTPEISFMHNNALLYVQEKQDFDHGIQRGAARLTYIDNVQQAYRDFLPRWGYALRFSYYASLFNPNFGSIYALYGRGFLPGIAPHHSLTLQLGAQYQETQKYAYTTKELFPRGWEYDFAVRRMIATSIEYQLPIAYPDGGINSIVYFRRLRGSLLFDFARFQSVHSRTPRAYQNANTYGGSLYIDFNPFRMTNGNATLKLTLLKPSNRNTVRIETALTIEL